MRASCSHLRGLAFALTKKLNHIEHNPNADKAKLVGECEIIATQIAEEIKRLKEKI